MILYNGEKIILNESKPIVLLKDITFSHTSISEKNNNMLGLGLSILAGAVILFLKSVLDFRTRALNDGAIVEALKCLNDAVKNMPDADPGRVLFDAYNVRVVADIGSTEARTCTINELNELL